MSQLAILREQLASLRRRRRAIRLGAALVAITIALLWTLAAIFLLDWQLSMSRPQRLVALAIGAGVLIWVYRRYARPMLEARETELDVALLVERQQQIDSDLVAALQFESTEAPQWGSSQLEGAVISYVAQYSRDSDLLAGFSAERFLRSGAALILTLVVVIGAVLWQPRYAATFVNRLAMGSQHYPTRTTIDELRVNGTLVAHGGQIVRGGYGQPVEFAVRLSGEIPTETHQIELTSISNGTSRPIELVEVKPAGGAAASRGRGAAGNSTPSDSAAAAAEPHVARFRARLPELVDSLQFQVLAGDAWTDPARLDVIPLPVVEPRLSATPPAYARQSAAASDEPDGSRQLSVLEGSRVDLQLECLNKRLAAATLLVGKQEHPLTKGDSDGRRWTLSAAGSPLARIADAVRYQIQVTDEDGLHLAQPIAGDIRIKIDRPPTISAKLDAEYFLPNTDLAEVHYTAADDYGLSAIRAIVEIQLGSAAAEPGPRVLEVLPIAADRPLVRPRIPYSGIYRLPLSSLKLVKGDQIRLTLEATDYRGDSAGKSTKSDPLVLHITDQSGIMAALGETDLRAARQMDALIQRQTQAGGLK